MIEDFVGKVITEKNKQIPACFELDTENKILYVETTSLWGLLFLDGGMLGALVNLAIDKKTSKKFKVDISSLQNVEFFRFGVSSKAIKLTLGNQEFKFLAERPKKVITIFEDLLKEAK